MRVAIDQLAGQLQKGLAPIYVVGGEDPLLVGEAADAVRHAARGAGYTTREVLEAGAGFAWSRLDQAASELSLFAERRVLELRMAEPKPGNEGAQALVAYAGRPAEDTVLMLITGRLDNKTQGSRWMKALAAAGVVVPVWPVEAAQLPRWIAQRMRRRGLEADRDAVAVLADRVEGNLLAAAQEIERLHLLHGEGRIDADAVARSVADSARFDIFRLVDAALAGDVARSCRVLAGLRAEGVEPVLVNWALSREVRGLASMAYDVAQGQSAEQAAARLRVWQKRIPLVAGALKRTDAAQWQALLGRCGYVDRVIKGVAAGNPWDELRALVVAMAGRSLPTAAAFRPQRMI